MRAAVRQFTVALLMALFVLPALIEAQSSGFSTRAIKEFDAALTSSGRFGVPRYTTALLPACTAGNKGAIAWDTTTNGLKGCDGSSWASVSSGATLAANTFTGVQTLPNGAVNLPALVFANSSTTGIWTRAANAIDFSANGIYAGEWSVVSLGIQLPSTSRIGFASDAVAGTSADAFFKRKAAAIIQQGADANGAVVAQQYQGANGITGTDIAAGNLALGGQVGTGAGLGSQTCINRALMAGTGTSTQTNTSGVCVCESKTLSNTSTTTTAVVSIASASNSAGGAEWTTTVVASDGTNFDVEQQTCNIGWVNKAGTFTVSGAGTPVCTGTVAASNSGSTTVGATVTAAASVVSINATPVFGTIVPTTVTSYTTIRNNSPGAVTCK